MIWWSHNVDSPRMIDNWGQTNSQASKHYIDLIKISWSEMIELCIFYKQHEHRLIIRDVHTNEYQVVQHKVVVNMLMIYIVSQVVPDQAVLWLCKLRLFQHQTTATFDGPQKTVNLTKQLLVYDSYPFINICSDMFILSFTSGTHRSCQMGETDQLHKCILFL